MNESKRVRFLKLIGCDKPRWGSNQCSSQKDIYISLGFDFASLVEQPQHLSKHELHEVLKAKYGYDDAPELT